MHQMTGEAISVELQNGRDRAGEGGCRDHELII
jgi:hypothetical protein